MIPRPVIVQDLVTTACLAIEEKRKTINANSSEIISACLSMALQGIVMFKQCGGDITVLHKGVDTLCLEIYGSAIGQGQSN